MKGYVYILSNVSMPGIYKIGCTQYDPRGRATDLSSPTGVPTPFKVEYYVYVEDYQNVEGQTHTKLYKYNAGKEFFKCDIKDCILSLKNIASTKGRYDEHYNNEHLKSQVEGWESTYFAKIRAEKEEEERKKRQEEIQRQKDREKNEIENRKFNIGCISIIAVLFISIWLARELKSSDWYYIGLIVAGCIFYFNFFERK